MAVCSQGSCGSLILIMYIYTTVHVYMSHITRTCMLVFGGLFVVWTAAFQSLYVAHKSLDKANVYDFTRILLSTYFL